VNVVLDLGCGPGADLCSLAEAVGSTGRVIGLDNDPARIAQARVRTSDYAERVEVVEADIHQNDRLRPHRPRTAACRQTRRSAN